MFQPTFSFLMQMQTTTGPKVKVHQADGSTTHTADDNLPTSTKFPQNHATCGSQTGNDGEEDPKPHTKARACHHDTKHHFLSFAG